MDKTNNAMGLKAWKSVDVRSREAVVSGWYIGGHFNRHNRFGESDIIDLYLYSE